MIDDFRSVEGVDRSQPAQPVQQPHTFAATASMPTFSPHPTPVAPSVTSPSDQFAHQPLAMPVPLDTEVVPTKQRRSFRDWLRSRTRKQKILLLAGCFTALLILAGGGVLALRMHKSEPVASGSTTKKAASAGAPVPTTVQSLLTGLPVDPAVNKRQVTGVMIENSTAARPQSGLDQAGVVFEAVAEGGITRFLALFQDTTPAYIGPVRSARPYYIQWCQSFDCAYAHVGGSPDALQDIKDWNIKDLNQFNGASFFQRIGSRAAPHNMYSGIDKLSAFEAQKGYTSSTYTGMARLAKEPKVDPATVTAKAINLNYAGSAYDVHYDYDAATNSYKRSEGGAAHTVVDASGTAAQLSPKVVIALAVPLTRGALDSSGAYYSNYQVIGSGEAYVFQNGTVTHGTWTKAAAASQLDFRDDKGTTIKLTPGQTWLSVLDSLASATYN